MIRIAEPLPADEGPYYYRFADTMFEFTGEFHADELQFEQARWFDPTVGKWMSDDPVGFAGGDSNLYRYVGNSPLLDAADPSQS
jgi:RHS repeat-associated protein